MAARKGKKQDWGLVKQQAQEARSAAAEIAALKDRAGEVQKELDTTSGTVSGLTTRAGKVEEDLKAAEASIEGIGDRPKTLKTDLEAAEGTLKEVGDRPATLKTDLEAAEQKVELLDAAGRVAEADKQLSAAETTMQEVGDRPATLKTDLEAAEGTLKEVGDRPATLKTDLESAEGKVALVNRTLTKETLATLRDNVTTVEGLVEEQRVEKLRTGMEDAESLLDKLAKPDEKEGEPQVDDPDDPLQVLEAKLSHAFRNAPEALSLLKDFVAAKVGAAVDDIFGKVENAMALEETFGEAIEAFFSSSEAKTTVENVAYEEDDANRLAILSTATARYGIEQVESHVTDMLAETDPATQEKRRQRYQVLGSILSNEDWKVSILSSAAKEIALELVSEDSLHTGYVDELSSVVYEAFEKVGEEGGSYLADELVSISQNHDDPVFRERAGNILGVME